MSNTVKIKHGNTAPTVDILSEYELGFAENNKGLYIKDESGVVQLNDVTGIETQIDEINTKLENVSGIVVSDTAPENTGALWIDTSDDGSGDTSGVAKYYDEATTTWLEVAATWG